MLWVPHLEFPGLPAEVSVVSRGKETASLTNMGAEVAEIVTKVVCKRGHEVKGAFEGSVMTTATEGNPYGCIIMATLPSNDEAV